MVAVKCGSARIFSRLTHFFPAPGKRGGRIITFLEFNQSVCLIFFDRFQRDILAPIERS